MNSENHSQFSPLPEDNLKISNYLFNGKIYDLSQEADQKALVEFYKERNITYLLPETPLPIIVAPVDVIGGGFGVFAKEELPKNREIGAYEGEWVDASTHSAYAFELKKKNKLLDASRRRNHTALINHSNLPNVVVYRPRKGDSVRLRVGSYGIAKGDQLFFDYGPDFFTGAIKHMYFDRKDGPKNIDQVFQENRDSYFGLVQVPQDFQNAFNLPTNQVMITKAMHAVIDPTSPYPINEGADLWCYGVQEGRLTSIRFTALMAACFLGNDHAVHTLINTCKADVNKQTLYTGETALFFVIKGKSQNRRGLAEFLFEREAYYNLVNSDNETLLHLALRFGDPAIIDVLLSDTSEAVRKEMFELLVTDEKEFIPLVNASDPRTRERLLHYMPS